MSGEGFFFQLGRRMAPVYLRTRWLWRAATGTEAERIRAEEGFGAAMAQALLESQPADGEEDCARWLLWLGRRLGGHRLARGRRFKFTALASAELNALALPGGFVFVTRGLLDACDFDADELAFVLGHEMAHVIREHAAKRMMNEQWIRLLSARFRSGRLAGAAADLATRLVRTGYSRENEFEADETGLRMAAEAGFDPAAAARVFDRLAAGGGSHPIPFLSSHPPIAERRSRVVRLATGLTVRRADP